MVIQGGGESPEIVASPNFDGSAANHAASESRHDVVTDENLGTVKDRDDAVKAGCLANVANDPGGAVVNGTKCPAVPKTYLRPSLVSRNCFLILTETAPDSDAEEAEPLFHKKPLPVSAQQWGEWKKTGVVKAKVPGPARRKCEDNGVVTGAMAHTFSVPHSRRIDAVAGVDSKDDRSNGVGGEQTTIFSAGSEAERQILSSIDDVVASVCGSAGNDENIADQPAVKEPVVRDTRVSEPLGDNSASSPSADQSSRQPSTATSFDSLSTSARDYDENTGASVPTLPRPSTRNKWIQYRGEGNRLVCPVCKESFTRSDRILDHIEAVHHRKIFICLTCDATVYKRSKRTEHLKLHEIKTSKENPADKYYRTEVTDQPIPSRKCSKDALGGIPPKEKAKRKNSRPSQTSTGEEESAETSLLPLAGPSSSLEPPHVNVSVSATMAAAAMAKTVATARPFASSTHSHFSLDDEAQVIGAAAKTGSGEGVGVGSPVKDGFGFSFVPGGEKFDSATKFIASSELDSAVKSALMGGHMVKSTALGSIPKTDLHQKNEPDLLTTLEHIVAGHIEKSPALGSILKTDLYQKNEPDLLTKVEQTVPQFIYRQQSDTVPRRTRVEPPTGGELKSQYLSSNPETPSVVHSSGERSITITRADSGVVEPTCNDLISKTIGTKESHSVTPNAFNSAGQSLTETSKLTFNDLKMNAYVKEERAPVLSAIGRGVDEVKRIDSASNHSPYTAIIPSNGGGPGGALPTFHQTHNYQSPHHHLTSSHRPTIFSPPQISALGTNHLSTSVPAVVIPLAVPHSLQTPATSNASPFAGTTQHPSMPLTYQRLSPSSSSTLSFSSFKVEHGK